ncbi:MAG: DUF433 domain-containing protein [Acidobacteriota bacterium]
MKEIALRIVVDENVASDKPVIRGTRVPVTLVVGKLAGGMEVDQVAREYGSKERMSWRHCPTSPARAR